MGELGAVMEFERSKSRARLIPQLAGSGGLGAGVTVMAAEAGGDPASVAKPLAMRTRPAKSASIRRSSVGTVFSSPCLATAPVLQ